jgi:sigma-E factor negative regulatory protein RseA
MNEMLDSQLSAMFDNELPAAECELLARRLSRDESLQARWRRYAIVGAVMRGEHGLPLHIDLTSRIRTVVAAEPTLSGAHLADSAGKSSNTAHVWKGAAALAVAASVAAVSIFWMRSQSPTAAQALVAQSQPASSTAPAEVVDSQPTYVVPPTVESRVMVPTAELANYVVAHSEYSAPLSRRNLLSSLVASEAGNVSSPEESEETLVPVENADTHVKNPQ